MEVIFLVSIGIIIFYTWADWRKFKDRLDRKKRERYIKWSKKTNKEKYGR